MGRKLDAFLSKTIHRNSPDIKRKLDLAIKHSEILRNRRRSNCLHARNDVVQFLKHGDEEKALERAAIVIQEQNMYDVLDIIERFCLFLTTKSKSLEIAKSCPADVEEAIVTLIYTASYLGDFPDLQTLKSTFLSTFGEEFVNSLRNLRGNCGVNSEISQKLPLKIPTPEEKSSILRQIASENGITLNEQPSSSLPDTETQNSIHTSNLQIGLENEINDSP